MANEEVTTMARQAIGAAIGRQYADTVLTALSEAGLILAASQSRPTKEAAPFQRRVLDWLMACFSMEVCRDGRERNHRFLEEALELVQSLGCTRSEAHQLVDYVFDRPAGDPKQKLGALLVTVAALCFPHDLNMDEAAETELARAWSKIDVIRAKQAAKPKHSPLPEAAPSASGRGMAEEGWQLVPKIETAEMIEAAAEFHGNGKWHVGDDSFFGGMYRAMLASAPAPSPDLEEV